MMESLIGFGHTLWSFFVVLSIIVFIHEFGHYIVARLCGVKVEVFSIGFGREIVGFTSRSGTRFRISVLPLGGYVKMFGDASAASEANVSALALLTEEERKLTFHFKPLYKKAAVVAAGPAANFVLTIGVFTYFIMTVGLPSTEPVAGEILPGSPAAEAGLKAGDRILKVGEHEVERFTEIPYHIATNLGTPVVLTFERAGKTQQVTLTPRQTEDTDAFGNAVKRPLIGIRSQQMRYEDVGLASALKESVWRTYLICTSTLHVLKQMIAGERGVEELKGPVGIAQLSGQATEKGISSALWLIAMLSANLGLVNLLPIPMLDGGHLAFYAVEAARGRPLAVKVQEYSFRVGFALLLLLMGFTVFNDIKQLIL